LKHTVYNCSVYVVQKRRQGGTKTSKGLSDTDKELLATNKEDRKRMDEDIKELRQRTVRHAMMFTYAFVKRHSKRTRIQ